MQCNSSNKLTVTYPNSPTQQEEKPLATLRDLQQGTLYHCVQGRNILASSRTNFLIDFPLEDDCNLIIIPSKTKVPSSYTAELEVFTGQSLIKVVRGKAFLKSIPLSVKPSPIASGQVIALGDLKYQLEFIERDQVKRKLPRSPLWGNHLSTMDLLRPKSISPNPPSGRLTSSISDYSLTSSYQMNNSLQQTLKRVSRDVQWRKTGQKDSKQPLPPTYEQVGNSIAYQLLLQSNPNITEKLINSMYPLLKELHSSSEWLFNDFLESFNESLKKKATPQCLHPSDMPTIKFLVDLCVHVSALPPDSQHRFLRPDPSLWMKLLAIFSSSTQNQQVLVDYRCPSKVVGCMNLTSMADNKDLQCHSWQVLSNVLTVPTPSDKKPPIHIQALTLLLSLMKQQLDQDLHRQDLIKSILQFLHTLCTIVRKCATTGTVDPENPLPYSQSYSKEVFLLLEDSRIREVVLDLPNFIQKETEISSLIENILISMAPLPTPTRKVPPPKPKRSRCRTQYILTPPSLQDEKTGPHPLHRKLPDVPSKRVASPPALSSPVLSLPTSLPPTKTMRSKSSDDILDSIIPCESSLPINLRHSEQKDSRTRSQIIITPSTMERSLPIIQTHSSTTVDSKSLTTTTPESLPPIKTILNDVSTNFDSSGTYLEDSMSSLLSNGFPISIRSTSPVTRDEDISITLTSGTSASEIGASTGNTTTENNTHTTSSLENISRDDKFMTITKTTSSLSPELIVNISNPLNDERGEENDDEENKNNSLSRSRVTSLSHYNRLSLKKTRSSYIKAVTASQKRYDEDETVNAKTEEGKEEEEHKTIVAALSERQELLGNINELWKTEKSLQAASNCVLSCFFNGCTDIPLFVDCLTCFISNTKYWTVGVCIVLLPYMRQVLTTQQNIRYLKTVFDVLSFIINKFSAVILSIKKKKPIRADIEQKQACYHELHLVTATLLKLETSDVVLLAMLEKFRQILVPFSDPL